MTPSHFPEYKYDIALEHDGSNRFMVWIIGCLVFIATLSMFSALASKQMIADWKSYASSHATIEIPFSENAETLALKVSDALTPLPIVEKLDIIPPEKTSQLITGALGANGEKLDAAVLPLPILIDVAFTDALDDNAQVKLVESIHKIAPKAGLHRHADWAEGVLSYGEMLYFGAIILLLLMGSMTVLTLIWTLMSRINIHHDEIEILTIVGADDRYIARQFQHFALSRTLKGCSGGILLAALTLALIHWLLGSAGILSGLSLSEIIGWLILPLGVCLFVAYVTARLTLSRSLLRL